MSSPAAVLEAPPRLLGRRRRWLAGDSLFRLLAGLSGLFLLVVAGVFVIALAVPAVPALVRFGPGFLAGREWNPVTARFGALPFIYGTVVTSALAMVIAFPVGLGAALYLAEETRWRLARAPLSFAVELLAGIPSVVIGLWALFVVVPLMRERIEPALQHLLGFLPPFRGPISGVSFFTAGTVLAIMILPILIALSRDVIRSVPRDLREGSLALGATRAETVWRVVIPYARAGLTGAGLLALGRALGETIAVTMVIGNRPEISALFTPGYTLPSVLANEFTEAVGALYQGALFELGLVLVVITVIVNIIARLLVFRFREQGA